MEIAGTTLRRAQEAELSNLIEVLQSGLGDQSTAKSYAKEVWALYHTVEGNRYVEIQPEDEHS